MAATIDHLRSDHHVRVLRDFTDARGLVRCADDRAIIRAMGLDTQRMELWIDWELGGERERLHFACRAETGPANGRMREYFELGHPAEDSRAVSPAVLTREPKAATPTLALSATHPAPGTSLDSTPMFALSARHPAPGTILGAVAVACHCDPALHRPVLSLGAGVNACMRCGTVTCTHAIGDDGRFTGDSWTAYVVDDVPAPLVAWLAQWPRVAVRQQVFDRWPTPAGLSRDVVVYLPADARCDTPQELAVLEDACSARTHSVKFPAQSPPSALPTTMQAFAQFSVAAALSSSSDLAQLFHSADPWNAASAVGVAKLLARADAFEVMVAALRSSEHTRQLAGAAMAHAMTPSDSRLPAVLADVLNTISLAPHSKVPDRVAGAARCEALLLVIADGMITAPEILAALPALQRRVVRKDETLASRIGEVLRELHGSPPPPPW